MVSAGEDGKKDEQDRLPRPVQHRERDEGVRQQLFVKCLYMYHMVDTSCMYHDLSLDLVQYKTQTDHSSPSHLLRLLIPEQNHRMSVNARMNTQSNSPPDSLGHPSLVHQPQSRLAAVLDATERGNEVADNRKVLSAR
jgi:hypothetical protein